MRLPNVWKPALHTVGQVRSSPGVLECQHPSLWWWLSLWCSLLNLIKTSLPRIIPASKPCRYLLGNFLNNFLGWVNEKTPPPSIPLKHHLEAISAAMASVHFSTGLLQVWNRPHCDWFTIRYAHFQGLLCFLVLTFSEFFMNNFRKAAGLPVKFYLTSEFWILFFFSTVGRNAPLREDITLSLS